MGLASGLRTQVVGKVYILYEENKEKLLRIRSCLQCFQCRLSKHQYLTISTINHLNHKAKNKRKYQIRTPIHLRHRITK